MAVRGFKLPEDVYPIDFIYGLASVIRLKLITPMELTVLFESGSSHMEIISIFREKIYESGYKPTRKEGNIRRRSRS